MKLSIVLSAQPARFQAATFQGELEDNLAGIASLGYTGVELAIRNPADLDLDALMLAVSRYGLQVPAIGTGQAWGEDGLSFTDPDPATRAAAVQRIISHIPLAARLNAIIIIGLIRGILKPGVDPSSAHSWLVQALQECSTAALPHGVRLALEPINRYETTLINTVDQGLELIQQVDNQNFGLLLDTFHMNIEEANLSASIQACGSRTFHVHVADSNRMHPGAGHLDFGTILRTLSEIGYPGWISGEFLPLPDPISAAERSLAYLSRIDC